MNGSDRRRGEVSPSMSRRRCLAATGLSTAGILLGSRRLLAAAISPSPALIEDLVVANRILADQGIVDAFGHVSVRHDKDPNRYLLARHVAPAAVTADDILEYDLDSNPLDLKGRSQYLERFIHGSIYKQRPDVKAVVHSHSPAVIPFTLSSVPLRPVFLMAAFIVQGVPVFDAPTDVGVHQLLVNNNELGHALAEKLGNKPAVLIRGHGAVIPGKSLNVAVGRSIYLEESARIQAEAIALGGNVTYVDEAAALKRVDGDYGEHAWEVWKKKAMGALPR